MYFGFYSGSEITQGIVKTEISTFILLFSSFMTCILTLSEKKAEKQHINLNINMMN